MRESEKTCLFSTLLLVRSFFLFRPKGTAESFTINVNESQTDKSSQQGGGRLFNFLFIFKFIISVLIMPYHNGAFGFYNQ